MVSRFVGGLGIGGSSVRPVYIAELSPAKWRGRMVGLFQINVVAGILLAYLSNFIISSRHLGVNEWRWEFGVAVIPSALFLVLLYGTCEVRVGYLMIEGFGYSADQPGAPGYLLADMTVSPEEIAVAGASYVKNL